MTKLGRRNRHVDTGVNIPREHKKALLFISVENRLWAALFKLRPAAVTQEAIADIVGVKNSAISNWKRTGIIDKFDIDLIQKNIEGRLNNVSSPAQSIFASFLTSYVDEDDRVYNTATILKIPLSNAQRILDETYYMRGPCFPMITYPTLQIAEQYLRDYEGLYYLWMERNSVLLQCTLRVRYVLHIQKHPTIRCKLNIPIIYGEQNRHWEYDGFIIVRDRNVLWMLQCRQTAEADFVYFITNKHAYCRKFDGSGDRDLTLSGQYLTVGQDEHRSIAADELLLQRRIHNGNDTIMEDLMKTDIRVVSGEARKSVDELWKEFDTNLS